MNVIRWICHFRDCISPYMDIYRSKIVIFGF
jgi:hypothetical protein